MISEKAIPAIKTAIDKTNKFRFQMGFCKTKNPFYIQNNLIIGVIGIEKNA